MTHHGGLQGKARRVYHERRASRLYAHQLIEEYFEPDDRPSRPQRFIPVRSRAEFLPSIAAAPEEPAVYSLGTQLELPLVARVEEPRGRSRARTGAPRSTPVVEPRVLRFPSLSEPAPASVEARQAQRAVRSSANASAKHAAATFKPWHAPRPRPFSVKEFLSGCAMGSAAAVVLLATLWVILG